MMPAPRTRYTEADILRKLRKEASGRTHKGQHISEDAIARVRRRVTNKSDWNTSRFDEWLVRMWTTGVVQLRKKDPRVRTEHERAEIVAKTKKGPEMESARATASIRRWVQRRGKGTLVTASMVKTMGMNLKRRSTKEVDAALVMLAAQGEITVENRKQGVGRSNRNWVRESLQWAEEQKWVTSAEARELEEKAAPNVTEHADAETVCIELGSGWGGATEGLRRVFDRVVEVDMQQHALKGGEKTKPDIMTTFQAGRDKAGGLARWIAVKSMVREGEMIAGWASPSCTEYSVSAAMNKNKEHAKGKYAGKAITKESQEGLDAVIDGFLRERAANPRFQYAIENVGTGAMAKADTAVGQMMTRKLGKAVTVTGCAYGRKSKKPYALWLSPEARAIFVKERILPSDQRSQCEACKANPPRRHDQVGILPKGNPNNQSRVREEGQTTKGAANRVPPALAEHVARCMKAAWDGSRDG